ncbi:DUF4386 domain-containing protein [Balneolaceae bacterium YR4-1]|uniref:DUF4386 domain-containing protein n=1 Tax=Halalkalibaculum roseum TaxID=2709311 RepID=A0A6M1SZ11_9BACT|nr:DUF4386 domain-containing protein [Halalkalibaculum roseum]NGP75095.1 DUF4386 domain-containing protein [Halalkalibaculum roseum]
MKNLFSNQTPRKAALVVGIAFITSVFVVTLIDDFLLANFVIPGDTAALAKDIKAIGKLFGYAVAGYLFVLTLDFIIGLALYVVLKPSDKKLAMIVGVLRLLYASILIIGLLALVFQFIDVYSYASIKLVGYIFFALHIFVLGYSVFNSGYIPKSLGLLLILASFTYIVFSVDLHLPSSLMTFIMLIMGIAELSLSIWLIVRRETLPTIN